LGNETEDDIQKAKNEYIHLRKTRDVSHSSRLGDLIDDKK
jgi:hypothetical protein